MYWLDQTDVTNPKLVYALVCETVKCELLLSLMSIAEIQLL
jgi:hypothetical protein